ncbi:MAG: hypothetical protein HQ509_02820 [Candidatus Marinimicrobia bacterium]|nr:hypothetical protein [Candidatus Neomarinimicrobiota bacterium]
MEQMVNDPNIKRVLLICNSSYQSKANDKKGGVGIESMIISDEIYSQADQKKFIPIVRESKDGKACLPTFVNSRFYIDLSDPEYFEDNYEQLLRNIFDKPKSSRPPIGEPPAFINQEDPIKSQTANKLLPLINALKNNKSNTGIFITEYLEAFTSSIMQFEFKEDEADRDKPLDEFVLERVEQLTVFRDEFILFLKTYSKYSTFDIEIFHKFFESILSQTVNSKYSDQGISDHFNFFNYELFLYFTSFLIKNELFEELHYILYNPFLLSKRDRPIEPLMYYHLNKPVGSLNKGRNERLLLNRADVTADTIKERIHEGFVFDELKEADILLYYVSCFQFDPVTFGHFAWWPHLTVYNTYRLPLIEKCISERHFNKVKILFEAKDKEELKSKVELIKEQGADRIQRFHNEFPHLVNVFDFEKIGKFK